MNRKEIRYHSTNHRSPEVSFSEALLRGLAPDGGLYLPSSLPVINEKEIAGFSSLDYYEIAATVLGKLIGTEIEKDKLLTICRESYNFPVPIEKVTDRMYVMRLDQGPTASFKDFAARMMSRLMQYFLARNNSHLTILTATSGDTGSAVASAFYGLENIDAVVLFPASEVTHMQRRQMTTLRDNIKVIAVNGKFDDCQRLVKQAFMDKELSHIPLSSANSINIGRLLPQSVYYFYSFSKLVSKNEEEIIFSVPSGNFGNLMGGVIAKKMGLHVGKFIISTNENNEVPEFLRTGIYNPVVPSRNCISSAMNVGHPSNLARIISLYGGRMDETGIMHELPDMESMKKDFFSLSVSDSETYETISDAFRKYEIILEPHGAVAWRGLNACADTERSRFRKPLCVALETAHPAKFPAEVKKALGFEPDLPPSLEGLLEKEEHFFEMQNDYDSLKKFILSNY